MYRRLALSCLPLLAGFLLSVLITYLPPAEILLVFRVGLGVVIAVGGAAISLGLWIALLARQQGRRDMLDQADQHRRSFIRRLDHELKNPLTGLRAALANLNEAPSPEERARAAANARRDLERLTRLLSDLRKLSDLDATVMEHQPVQIPDLLGEMSEAALGRPKYSQRSIQSLIARVPPLSPVLGDRDLLGLAFYNLMDNALKFTDAENALEVRAREDGRMVVVEVADNGPGIAAEDLPHLFEELYRGVNAHGVEGSGLGLALTSRIIALHGGNLRVVSRPGATVFSVSLPVGR